jgi:hypothetical protein
MGLGFAPLELMRVGALTQGGARSSLCPGLLTDGPLSLPEKPPMRRRPCPSPHLPHTGEMENGIEKEKWEMRGCGLVRGLRFRALRVLAGEGLDFEAAVFHVSFDELFHWAGGQDFDAAGEQGVIFVGLHVEELEEDPAIVPPVEEELATESSGVSVFECDDADWW